MPMDRREAARPLVSILGPTACGKTAVAVAVARAINGGILSADSRQLYRGMDIGTGKDLEEFGLGGAAVPYFLIDVAEAGDRWSLYDYLNAFYAAHGEAAGAGLWPILCGGTGLYAEAVLRGYDVPSVPANEALRAELSALSMEELVGRLARLQPLHNTTDTQSRARLIRAIEIASATAGEPAARRNAPRIPIGPTFAIAPTRATRRARITIRLDARLAQGLIDEARRLLALGVSHETLQYYGLEYRFASRYLLGELSLDAMRNGLEHAIHQFAKRQMTYLRGMERRGVRLQWVDGDQPREAIVQAIVEEVKRIK